MFIVFALIGFGVGYLLNWAVDYLPRLSASIALPEGTPARNQPLRHRVAVWRLVSAWHSPARYDKWLWLAVFTEILSAISFAWLWTRLGLSWSLVFAAGSYSFFLLITLIDLKYRLVLNILIYPALALVLFIHIVVLRQYTLNILLGGFIATSIFFLTANLKPGQLGGGDVKLAALLGFSFGFPQILWVLIIGAGMGAIVAIVLLVNRRGLKTTIPYAPFLCLGAILALLYNLLPLSL